MAKQLILKFKEHYLKLLLVFLLIFGVSVRFVHLSDHFTHVDSVFMIMDILKAKDPGFKETMMQRAFDPDRPAYDSAYKKALRYLGSQPKFEPFLDLAFKLSPIFIVSVTGANPPLQFVANVPLINDTQNYRQLLFWGRFPAFFYAALALLAFITLIRSLNLKQDFWPLAVIALSFLCFSWQQIIYAKQVYQYSLNSLVPVLFLLSFVQVLKGKNNFIFSSLIPLLLYYCSYQTLWLLPAFYLLMFFNYYRNKDFENLKKIFWYAVIVGFFVLPSLIYNLFHFIGYSTKYYQIGPNGEFLFQPWLIGGFAAKIIYVIKFFIVNSFLTYRANIVPYPVETVFGVILSFIYFGLFLLGGYVACNDKNELVKNCGRFILLGFLFLFISNLTGQMPLSPCRLSIFYLAFFVFYTAYGLFYLVKLLPFNKQNAVIALIAIVLTLIFVSSYPLVMKDRLDPVKEDMIKELMDKYNIKTVVSYDLSQNIHLMPELIKKVNYYEDDYPRPARDLSGWDYQTILYFSTRTPLTEKPFYDLQKKINDDKEIRQKWHYRFADYQVLYNYAYDTDVQVEYTKDNINPTNDLYLTVIKLKKGR